MRERYYIEEMYVMRGVRNSPKARKGVVASMRRGDGREQNFIERLWQRVLRKRDLNSWARDTLGT